MAKRKKPEFERDAKAAQQPHIHRPKNARPHVAQEMREADAGGGILQQVCHHLRPWAQSQALGVPPSQVGAYVGPSLTFQGFQRREGGGVRVK
jgi:hypothetical protein